MTVTMTKMSISLPTDLLHLARNAGLIDARTNVSALLAQLLREAIERRDAAVSAAAAATEEEEALSAAMLRGSAEAMAQEFASDRNDYAEWKARRADRSAAG